ncbi:hypothetical protein HMPREF9136_0851 [Prevotella dentalis DSM 3688]|uniref:Uncharacterized protein n=1 Tax=Prevotella dentalis (strain ATCC 49559 / DSM 3688 / JCM 13448 / NCTC 12043 / ES 2772) TaxID=908937 RepID=F9D1X3_PREDD|nr:hypothetical protein HMPREF9136_0851 [Prevotella dentalis DSM 3688]
MVCDFLFCSANVGIILFSHNFSGRATAQIMMFGYEKADAAIGRFLILG